MDVDTPPPLQDAINHEQSLINELIVLASTTSELSPPQAADELGPHSPTPTDPAPVSYDQSPVQKLDPESLYSSQLNMEPLENEITVLQEIFKRRLGLQFSSAYSDQEPMFIDQFSAKDFPYSGLELVPATDTNGRVTGAPKGIFAFRNWLRAHDSVCMALRSRMCSTIDSIRQDDSRRWRLHGTYGASSTTLEDAQETRAFLEWLLAGAIIDSGLVCLIGPRGSGKSHLLRRVLHQLVQKGLEESEASVDLSAFRAGPKQAGNPISLLPTPYLPLRIINLQALQTQDPFDLATYILNDLRQIVESSEDDERDFGDITAQLNAVTDLLRDQSESGFQHSRLKVLREHYSKVIGYLGRCITEATKKFQLVFVIEDFDLLAGERQTFLYTLIDIMSKGYSSEDHGGATETTDSASFTVTTTPITAVMLTSRLDSFSLLEKRVASRFPQRQIILNGPTSLTEVLTILALHLLNPQVPLIPEHQLLVEKKIIRKNLQQERKSASEFDIVYSSAPVDMDDPERSESVSFGSVGDEDEDDDMSVDGTTGANHSIEAHPLNDPSSTEHRLQRLSRKMWLDWNQSVLDFFDNPSPALVKVMNDMADATLCPSDFFQVFQDALSKGTGSSPTLKQNTFISCAQAFLQQSSHKIQLGKSCSILQLLLLIEMDRLEQQIKAGIEKSGSPFVDFDLPTAAKAVDLAAAMKNKGKRSSDGSLISGVSEPKATGARSDRLALKFFHFERVYHEYSHWITSDGSLRAFKYPKEVVRKAFDGLIDMKLVAPCSESRYHHQIRLPPMTPLSAAFQSVKLLVSTREVKEIIAGYTEELPDMVKARHMI